VVLYVVVIVLEDVSYDGFLSLLYAAAVFGILNTVLKPLLHFVTFPVRAIFLGPLRIAIAFAISLAMLGITSLIVDGFNIDSFMGLVWATLVAWIVNVVFDLGENMLVDREKQAGAGAG